MTIYRELPTDLVEEILCRVPTTSLKRLRTTCKEWNRLFKHDSRFARKHSDKSPKEFEVLRLTNQHRICQMRVNLHEVVPSVELRRELSLIDPHSNNSGAKFDISQIFHCDGLLLCTSYKDQSRLVVWNSCTGQTKWIRTNNRSDAYVLGYLQDKRYSNKSYKILSYCYGSSKDSEIYDFSSDSWRILDHDITPGSPCLSLKGKAYWFAEDSTKTHPGQFMHIFDFSTEKSSLLVPLPYQFDHYETSSLSVVREEKLSVLLHPYITSKTEIWVTNKIDETKPVSWSKVLALDLSPNLQISIFGTFMVDEEKKVVALYETWFDVGSVAKDGVYIVGEDNKVRQLEFGVDESWPLILNYVPSLVQIDRARGTKRRRGD